MWHVMGQKAAMPSIFWSTVMKPRSYAKDHRIWTALPESVGEFRPALKARTVIEQMEHQVQSEGRWMKTMLGIDTGDPNPPSRTQSAFIAKYRADATARLWILREKPEVGWREKTAFFDVARSRARVFTRADDTLCPHRGQLVVYLRLLGVRVPSVYGATAYTTDASFTPSGETHDGHASSWSHSESGGGTSSSLVRLWRSTSYRTAPQHAQVHDELPSLRLG